MAESAARKDVKLRVTVETDATRGSRALQDLAREADKVEASAGKAAKALTGVTAGTRTPGGAAGLHPGGATSAATAFGRPVPVVIVGPRPLPVTGIGGGAGGSGGAGGGKLGDGKADKDDDDKSFLSNWKTKAVAKVAMVGGVASLMANLTEAVQGLDNPLTTAREKVLGFAAAVPLIGSTLKKLTGDILDMAFRWQHPDAAKALDKRRMEHPLELAKARLEGELGPKMFEPAAAAGEAMVRTDVDKFMPGFGMQSERGFPAIGAGPILQALPAPMTAAMDAARQAERELEVANRVRLNATNYRSEAERAAADADKRLAEAKKAERAAFKAAQEQPPEPRLGRGGVAADVFEKNKQAFGPVFGRVTGAVGAVGGFAAPEFFQKARGMAQAAQRQPEWENALMDLQKKADEAVRAHAALEQAANREREKAIEYERKRYDLMTKQTEVMKTRVGLLQDELNKGQAAARQFGGMDIVSQRAVREAYGRFEKFGREGVTQEEYSQMSGMGLLQDNIARQAEEAAGKSEIYKDLMTRTGKRDLTVINEQLVKAKTEVAVKVELDQQQLNKAVEKELGQFEARLRQYVTDAIKAAVAAQEGQTYLGRVQQANQ